MKIKIAAFALDPAHCSQRGHWQPPRSMPTWSKSLQPTRRQHGVGSNRSANSG
jgi:hypothetical protein